MENKLVNGDYVPDGLGGIVRLTGNNALLQRALFHLSCRRGAFAPLPELGSELYLLPRKKPADRRAFATTAAQQALTPLGLTVSDAEVMRQLDGIFVVTLTLENSDTTLEVTV